MRMCSLQPAPVGGRLSEFVEGWKHITNDPYVLSIVTKGYRLRFTSPPLLRETPWEMRSPQEPEEIQGMLEQISLLLQKNAVTEVPPNSPGFYSNCACRMHTFMYQYIQAAGIISGLSSKTRFISSEYFPSV